MKIFKFSLNSKVPNNLLKRFGLDAFLLKSNYKSINQIEEYLTRLLEKEIPDIELKMEVFNPQKFLNIMSDNKTDLLSIYNSFLSISF